MDIRFYLSHPHNEKHAISYPELSEPAPGLTPYKAYSDFRYCKKLKHHSKISLNIIEKNGFLHLFILFLFAVSGCNGDKIHSILSSNDLGFTDLSKSWDKGIPLDNAIVGILVWQKDSMLRMPLNHAGLNALCDVQWAGGTNLQTFVHATENKGNPCNLKSSYGNVSVRLFRNGKPSETLSGELLTFNISLNGTVLITDCN